MDSLDTSYYLAFFHFNLKGYVQFSLYGSSNSDELFQVLFTWKLLHFPSFLKKKLSGY
jgi:hypothetical protein